MFVFVVVVAVVAVAVVAAVAVTFVVTFPVVACPAVADIVVLVVLDVKEALSLINAFLACVYIYIRQLSSFRATTSWLSI